jgi:HIRAN domain
MNAYLAGAGEPGLIVEGRLVRDENGFFQSVAGESFHQEVLCEIAQAKGAGPRTVEFVAFLLPEPENPHDSNAVRVVAPGYGAVGYLPREDAASLHALFVRLRAANRCLACPARLTGGSPGKPHFGVTLSLPPAATLIADGDDLVTEDRGER